MVLTAGAVACCSTAPGSSGSLMQLLRCGGRGGAGRAPAAKQAGARVFVCVWVFGSERAAENVGLPEAASQTQSKGKGAACV